MDEMLAEAAFFTVIKLMYSHFPTIYWSKLKWSLRSAKYKYIINEYK